MKWCNCISQSFECTNGIKQGGVLSPILFCVYMDELLCRLERNGVGCFIGKEFMGAFSYADDLSLLAPSVSALRKMLCVCEEFAGEYNVIFNGSKSALLLFKAPVNTIDVYLSGCKIPICQTALHLGTFVGIKSEKANMSRAIGNVIYRTNMILSRYGYCDSDILLKLFDSYCTSYYGSSLWDLTTKGIEDIEIAWRKCMRRILKLNFRTRSRYIPLLTEKKCIHDQLLDRFAKFYDKCNISANVKVRTVTMFLPTSTSNVAHNLRMLAYRRCHTATVNKVDLCTVAAIKELQSIAKGILVSPLTKQEAEELMNCLCVI